MWRSDESHSFTFSRKFVTLYHFSSQYFPQCVKYLFKELNVYWVNVGEFHDCIKRNERIVVKESFVKYQCEFIKFDIENVHESTPEDLDLFAECKNVPLLALLLKDRWFKGDFVRLKQILKLNDYTKLLIMLENILWERSYEDNYTLGQQMSIRMTTNLIQNGLDFKHHVTNEKLVKGRGWCCEEFERMLSNINSMADITKRYKLSKTYVLLELDRNNMQYVLLLLKSAFNIIITNMLLDNVCLIKSKSGSLCILKSLAPLLQHKLINVVFVTDTENYLYQNKLFYIYNSMKFYYYCLKNKFVFMYDDYETLYYMYTIIILEILNGGCLNSFTLEKSPIMHPLELNSRRCNALKRSAAYNKTLCNDMELKVDFIKGKRITTGAHLPNRIVHINE
ncbi:p47 [Matsumuraeses phaseoli granulovirus]|uniref:P47 n=1 Tax=Matsumuraeses phaseoli granulovirus TaxID=2760664 RepID=A0AAE7MLC9_9BBAC|nr:p47 [Matsumuraeses phaseoli granulovirus]QOD40023.1 p47 [Matsumuraeses phaseoli granulovirus]